MAFALEIEALNPPERPDGNSVEVVTKHGGYILYIDDKDVLLTLSNDLFNSSLGCAGPNKYGATHKYSVALNYPIIKLHAKIFGLAKSEKFVRNILGHELTHIKQFRENRILTDDRNLRGDVALWIKSHLSNLYWVLIILEFFVPRVDAQRNLTNEYIALSIIQAIIICLSLILYAIYRYTPCEIEANDNAEQLGNTLRCVFLP